MPKMNSKCSMIGRVDYDNAENVVIRRVSRVGIAAFSRYSSGDVRQRNPRRDACGNGQPAAYRGPYMRKIPYTLPPEGMDEAEQRSLFEWNSELSSDEAYEALESYGIDKISWDEDLNRAYAQWIALSIK